MASVLAAGMSFYSPVASSLSSLLCTCRSFHPNLLFITSKHMGHITSKECMVVILQCIFNFVLILWGSLPHRRGG